jgi:hypothetical protein
VRSIIYGYLDPRSVVKFSGVNKNYYQEITNDPSYAAALFKGMLDYIGHQDPALQVSVIREVKLPGLLLTFLPKSREKVFDDFRDAALNLTDEYARTLAIGKVAAGLGAIENAEARLMGFDQLKDEALKLTREYPRALAIRGVAAGLRALEPEMLLQCVVALKTGSNITQTLNTPVVGSNPIVTAAERLRDLRA